ncbi:uncharacterized protein BP5553_07736 [Venustampulla echinocandica]|uniref:Ubiquitin-like domain-containing protein n=1 Tax=Venustampulla echinocandica TaxID=2656787 RepID=A0A370THE4_9HELO|nr:uncharacterized protein BP5553_07736 [Venustampulla echinocandica]RDL34608.1 hypothetical protein BP5553_07736 [Venustampulla echinocandica]
MAEDTGEGSLDNSKLPPAKRSLFSKDVLAKASSEPEEAVAFFSRSREIFPQRLAEEERRRQRKIARQERKRSPTSVDRKESSPPEEKKRRISTKDPYSSDEDIAGSSRSRRKSTPSRRGSHKSDSIPAQHDLESSPTTLSGGHARDLRAERRLRQEARKSASAIISLSDSDSDKRSKTIPVRKAIVGAIVLDDDDDDSYVVPRKATTKDDYDLQLSDEEFPELIHLAREREKQKALQRQNAAKAFDEQSHQSSKGTTVDDDIFETAGPIPSKDPVVDILITSQIEGSKPLIVKRKLSQRLKDVRTKWCEYQSMGSNLEDKVFLTWRGKRLFDSTTCMALGLRTDARGILTADGGVDEAGRIHLEVWTEELHSAYQKMQAAKDMEDDQSNKEEASEQDPGIPTMRLVFKARGLEDFKAKVRPTTTVERMIESFRRNNNLPASKEVSMYVDGDKLDSASTVEDAELEDLDVVEVHIR